MIPSEEEIIKKHTAEVIRGKLRPNNGQCPNCNGEPALFSIHEKKVRQFLVLVVDVVKKVESLLIRWKCPLCKRTFTEYPEFALPYKRHVKETVMKLSGKYVFDEGRGRVTYEEAVKIDRLPIGYVDKKGEAQDHYLSPSTVWKWIGFLGRGNWLEKMLTLVKEKMPQTGIFRDVKQVSPYKYRSEERKEIVARCMKVLDAGAALKKLFGFSPTSP